VAKQVAETIGYPTPNLAARKLLKPEVANDKSLYPDAETISKGNGRTTSVTPAASTKSITRS
jgi:spermidine/putrescine-binding protein